MKMEKQFKITKNGFCRDVLFLPGYSYKTNKISICNYGFHSCKNFDDLFNFYTYEKGVTKIFEVLVSNDETGGEKTCSKELKVLREIPFVEWKNLSQRMKWDEKGNLTEKIYWDGTKDVYSYDEKGNLTEKIYRDGKKEIYKYDEKGNLTEKIYWDGTKEIYKYDKKGNLTEKIYWNGTKEFYDEKGNLTEKIYQDSTKEIFTYDEENRLIGKKCGDIEEIFLIKE